MVHKEFVIGLEFTTESHGARWRCTDVGTRTIIAIQLDATREPDWYNGPPYAVAEQVFDEDDFGVCIPVEPT